MSLQRARDFGKLTELDLNLSVVENEVEDEDDKYDLYDELDFNKTLPRNFRINQFSRMDDGRNSLGVGPPKRSLSTQHIPTTACHTGTLSRMHPVASPSSSLSNLVTLGLELRKSDPSLHRKKANSFHIHSKSMDERSRLPVRAQSLYTKSQSPPYCSPRYTTIGSSPCGSPHNMSPGMSTSFFYARRDLDRGRRWSATSSGYSTTGCTDSPSSLSSYDSQETLPQGDDAALFQQSSASLWSLMDEDGSRSLKRSRSLSPIRSSRSSVYELESLNQIFRDRFPRAKEQMEEHLQEFLVTNAEGSTHYSDGYLSYLRNQIIQHARDLLAKSTQGLLSSQVFLELAESLDNCIHQNNTKKDDASMKKLINQLLAIISRPARLLEVLDFNVEAYYQSLDDNEYQHTKEVLSSHVPFLLSRLKASLDSTGDESGTQTLDPSTKATSVSRTSIKSTRESPPQLPDFERIKLISQGAYSSVYLVRHKQTKMRFAMKRLSKQRMIMKKQVQNIFHERDVLTVAENPFLVGLWCSFQTERSLYLVMEYVEGGDLGTLIKNIGCLPLELARMYFAETVLALEYIHNMGIIHRDLKPDNLLITADGHIKVTDFGLSKMGLASLSAAIYEDHLNLSRDQQFTDEQILGTPDYIAPEVILGRAYGFPVDWWAMGVVLYQMLLGITPFASTTVEALFEEITNDNLVIEWPTEEDEEEPPPLVAQNLVEQLLQQEPQSRLGSASRNGVAGVKEHVFFTSINWDTLLRQKAQFVPELHGEDDTSYFDTRSDRYHHDEVASDEEDYDDELYEFPFTNFGTVTKRYSRIVSSEKDPCTSQTKPEKYRECRKYSSDYESGQRASIDSISSELEAINRGLENAKLSEELEDEDPMEPIIGQSQPCVGGEGLLDETRDGTVTPETPPVIDTPLVTVEVSPPTTIRKRRGRNMLLATSPSPTHPITVTPPTPDHLFSVSPESDPLEHPVPSVLLSPRRGSIAEIPYYIHRGEHGYGIVLQSVRVYLAVDSNRYRLHHFLQHVEEGSSAWDAGLRPGFVITHVNGESVVGLLHVQVVHMMLKRRNEVLAIGAIPLESTSIQARPRDKNHSMGHRVVKKLKKLKQKTGALKKRSRTIFRNSKDHSSLPLSRPQSPPSSTQGHSTQSPKRNDPSRSESFKERMRRVSRIGSPKKPISPLAHSPSPTSIMVNRSRSTSPLTVTNGGSPTSSPTGSSQHLNEIDPRKPSARKAPERSSSCHSALPSNRKMQQSPARPERRSWIGELTHSRRSSCEGISGLVTASNKSSPIHQQKSPQGSPLVVQRSVPLNTSSNTSCTATKDIANKDTANKDTANKDTANKDTANKTSTLSGIKPLKCPVDQLSWKERRDWFDNR